MNRKRWSLIAALVAMGCMANLATAGPLPTDPNAMMFWQGSQSFVGSANGHTLDAKVEYAVYVPGAFGTSAALGFPAAFDPSGGTQFVYAYEIFNNLVSTAIVKALSVGLEIGAIPNGSMNIGHAPVIPGLTPDFSQFIPGTDPEQSAKWTWATTTFPANNNSDILLFTSPLGPEFFSSSMTGGNATLASALLPSPVPEPATFVLAATALGSLLLLTASKARRLRR
jgi:hypothetical protein